MWLGHVTLQCVGCPQTKGLVFAIGSYWGKKKKTKVPVTYRKCTSGQNSVSTAARQWFVTVLSFDTQEHIKSYRPANFHASSPHHYEKINFWSFSFLRLIIVLFDILHPYKDSSKMTSILNRVHKKIIFFYHHHTKLCVLAQGKRISNRFLKKNNSKTPTLHEKMR